MKKFGMEEIANGLSKDMNFQASFKIAKESAERILEENDLDGNKLSHNELFSILKTYEREC